MSEGPQAGAASASSEHFGPDLSDDVEKAGKALDAKASKVRFVLRVRPAGEPDQLAGEAPESVRGLFVTRIPRAESPVPQGTLVPWSK